MTRLAAALVVVAGAIVSQGVPSARAGSAQDEVVERVLGCHVFSGGDAERKALDEAIEGVVAEFNFLLRPVVRSRLKDANPVIARVCLARSADRVTVSLDGRKYSASLDGKSVKVKGITGDELDLRLKVDKIALWQIFEGKDGGRINGFRRSDADHVVMKVRISSERLPKALIYQLTYRRK